jgi:hydroxypyruvate isomerase
MAAGQTTPVKRKGRLKQCVTTGVFGRGMPFEDMCRHAADLGAYGFDLIGPDKWPVLKKFGLVPTMMPPPYGGTIPDGIIDKTNHERLEKSLHEAIDLCAAEKVPNAIVLAGSRHGMPDAEGADHAVEFFDKVKKHAEDKGVILCLELLNSKVDHKDYMCDHTAWGVGVMKRVDSPQVKLLYDIYHMQIMEGDIVRTIRDNFEYLAHFHTGGNPGRHEIDGSQELNYRFIAQAIADLGFTGQVAHEFGPAKGHDPIESLKQAMEIFDV